MAYWIGTRQGDRKDHLADEGQCPLRVAAEELVVVPPDKRQGHQHTDTPDGVDQPALEGVEAKSLLEVEIAEHRHGEQSEADGRERDEHVLMVRMRMIRSKAASMDGAAGGVSLMTSPKTPCFSNCPRWGLLQSDRKKATKTMGIARI